MFARQLSIWDNVALEDGYRHLAHLELEEAVNQFQEALSGNSEQKDIQQAIAACQYWQPRIQLPATNQSSITIIKDLLADYRDYSFTSEMASFKRALLFYIVDLMEQQQEHDLKTVETVFDLLLKPGVLQKAEELISSSISRVPEKYYLLYFLAQAQWLQHNKIEADRNYTKALLSYPDNSFMSRIENEKIKSLIQSHGPENAPAYGWIRGILPFIALSENIAIRNQPHQKAIEAYRFLKIAEESLKSNDLKSSIRYRKALKTVAPKLYEAYFALLQRRK